MNARQDAGFSRQNAADHRRRESIGLKGGDCRRPVHWLVISVEVAMKLNPANTVCVVKHEGREVGRVAATAANASAYIQELTSHYKNVTVDYIEDADAAMIGRMLFGARVF